MTARDRVRTATIKRYRLNCMKITKNKKIQLYIVDA